MKLVKLISPTIAEPLTYIVSLFFNSHFSKLKKESKVIPSINQIGESNLIRTL